MDESGSRLEGANTLDFIPSPSTFGLLLNSNDELLIWQYPMSNLRRPFRHLDPALLAALLLPVFAILPLIRHAGLPNTADGPVHLMRQVELNQAWQQGVFYPRWAADLALGHGMPLFSYAPPALYQITQLFHVLGLPLDAAMKGSLVLDFVLYSLGMFLFARRIFGAPAALVAASAYVYAPYRLREAFIQGNYGQFTGLAFYPFILWGFHGLLTDPRPRRYLLPAALALSGLLLSHNISAMLFAPLLLAYLAFLLFTPRPGRDRLRLLPQTSFAILLGLGLSALFWLPAFGERAQIRLEGITQGFFDFRDNFITLAELTAVPRPLDQMAINPEFPLALGLGQVAGAGLAVLLLIAGVAAAVRPSRTPPPAPGRAGPARILGRPAGLHVAFFGLALAIYAFLALPASQAVWEAVPLLELAEFPWRMLGPALLAAAFLCGGAFQLLTAPAQPADRPAHPAGRDERFLLPIGVFAFVVLNVYYLVPAQFIPWGTPSPAEAVAYEAQSGALGTTSTGEFLPRWADRFPRPETLQPDYEAGRLPQKLDPAGLPEGATARMLAHLPEADLLQVDTPRPFEATLRTLYWPGWEARIDGRPVPLHVTAPDGLIRVAVPAGQHRLELRLVDTPLRTAAEFISLLSFGVLLATAAVVFRGRRRAAAIPAPPLAAPRALRPAWPLIAGLLAGAVALQLAAPRFQLRSDPDRPVPASYQTAVDFGDQVRLVGFDPGPAMIRPGDTLALTAYWRALQPLEDDYAVFLHLDDPTGETTLTFDERHPADIPTSHWPPGLYLRQPLRLHIPADLAPIRYTLRVGLYRPEDGQRLTLSSGAGDGYALGQVWFEPERPLSAREVPALPETVRFGPHVELLGAAYQVAAPLPQSGDSLSLYWRTDAPLDKPYTIFVHLLDAEGRILAQSDTVPYGGRYPTDDWRPGQIILDTRSIAPMLSDTGSLAAFAIGLYDPISGTRLPAVTAGGQALPDNAFVLPLAGAEGPGSSPK